MKRVLEKKLNKDDNMKKVLSKLYKLNTVVWVDEYIFRKIKNKLFPSRIVTLNNKISYAGWWKCADYESQGFTKFLTKRFPEYSEYNIRFYSVFSDIESIKKDCELYGGKKIFFSVENLEKISEHKSLKVNNYRTLLEIKRRINSYSDYLSSQVDLCLGYREDCGKFLQFPGWMFRKDFFPAESEFNDVKKIIDNINNVKSKYLLDCVCINSHDALGLRTKIADDLNSVLDITYAGKWRNNTSDLWDKYGNDKLKYMNLFKFNICPENMDAPHYCTEKIFDSFRAGCIPIYAGALNNPLPDVINKNAVIFWDLDGDNADNIKLIKRLKMDEDFYNKFMQQEKLLPSAAEYVYGRFNKLEEMLRSILSK